MLELLNSKYKFLFLCLPSHVSLVVSSINTLETMVKCQIDLNDTNYF